MKLLILFGFIITSGVLTCNAGLIQIDFSGVVTELPEGFSSEAVNVGSSLSGFLQYDDGLPIIFSPQVPTVYKFGGPIQFSASLTNGETITPLDWNYAVFRIGKYDGLFEPSGDALLITVQREEIVIGSDPIRSVTFTFETASGSALNESSLESSTPLILGSILSPASMAIRVPGLAVTSIAMGTFEYGAVPEPKIYGTVLGFVASILLLFRWRSRNKNKV